MELVRQVCHQNNVAAVVVIHQPNGYIFETFDRLILLSHGRTIFSDHVSKLGSLYKHHFGREIPTSKHELPVDLLERCKSTKTTFLSPVEVDTNARPFVPSDASFMPIPSASGISSMWKLWVVFQRNLLNHYWQIGDGQNPSMVGAFIFILLLSYLLPFCWIPVFVHDKKFFLSERSLGLYSPWIYCLSQALLEIWVLILGAVVQSTIFFPMAETWNDEEPKWVTFMSLQAATVASGLTGSAMVLFFCILLPSQDLAFIASSGLVSMSLCISGGFVPFNQLRSFISWLQVCVCVYIQRGRRRDFIKSNLHSQYSPVVQPMQVFAPSPFLELLQGRQRRSLSRFH